jgi:putative membrane protein
LQSGASQASGAQPGGSQPSASQTSGSQTSSSAASGQEASQATTAQAYVSNAAMGDMFEIQSSQLAVQKAQTASVKSFAQMMIDGHTATSAKLKPIAQQAGVAPPAMLDAKHQAMISSLQAASATEFEKRYIEQQTTAHQEALALHQGYASKGDNAALRAFASQTAPIVEQHLAQLRKLGT